MLNIQREIEYVTTQHKEIINRTGKDSGAQRHSKKDKRHIMLFNKFVFVNEPPPVYQETQN